MAKWIKSTQASACDNEVLSIKCNEDYIIDVITVEHTILAAPAPADKHVKDTRVSNNQPDSTTITKLLLSDSNVVAEQEHQEQVVCQQPAAPVLQLSSSSSGNGTATTGNNNGGQSGVCDQNQAKTLTSSRDIAVLVRNECRSRNTCTLDLRWPRATNGNTGSGSGSGSNSNTTKVENEPAANGTTQRAGGSSTITPSHLSPTTSQALGLRANGFLLSKLVNEPCPGNRKLVEIVYKCRPLKMSKRTVCQNSPLHLECPNDRRLVVVSGDYGAWANDTKNHERCLNDPNRHYTTNANLQSSPSLSLSSTTATNSSDSTNVQSNQLQVQLTKNCLVSPSNTIGILATNCLFKRTCDLSVTPATFGDAQCPTGQVEYLKMVYICINETLLIESAPNSSSSSSSSSSLLVRPVPNRGQHHRNEAQLFPTKSSNVSSLLPQVTTNLASQTSSLTEVSNDQQQLPVSAGSPQSSSTTSLHSVSSQNENGQTSGWMDDSPSPHKITPFVVSADSTKISTLLHSGSSGGTQSNFNLATRLKYLLMKNQSIFVASTMAIVSIMLFAITLRICRLRSAASNSSSVSKDSTCSTKSSTGGFKSYGSSSSSSHGGVAQNSNGSSNAKHNSCSESCFSLDEYNFNNGSNGNHSLDSPALESSNTPLDNVDTSATNTFGAQTVRPKLWTIYTTNNNNEQQAVTNPLRMSTQHHHHTMRPTRSFVGQQPSQIHQLRALQCIHQSQQNNQHLQQLQQQQQIQAPPGRDSMSSAQDLLLQAAPNQQPAQSVNHQQQAVNWCNTALNQQVESPQQIDSQTQVSVAATTIPHLHHIDSANAAPTAPPQHCAFHQSQQQQQQQQHLIFAPQNIQLEFSQPGATILASQQQQQQQSQQQHLLLQHQQQQAVLDMRQFHPNFHP